MATVQPRPDLWARCVGALRTNGGRLTASRRAIVAALLDTGGHVTAEQLATIVQAEHPETALSTVYRTMEVLERAGLVEHLHLGHGPAVYHLAEHDHRHLVCQECGCTIEVSEAAFDELAVFVQRRLGFTLDARHFALPGRCGRCVGGADTPHDA